MTNVGLIVQNAGATQSMWVDFEYVLGTAIDAKNIADSTKTDRAGAIVDTLLLKNILAGKAIAQLRALSVEVNEPVDFTSVAVLSRSILEGYLAIHYFCSWNCSNEQKKAKLLWWKWHELNERLRTLRLVNSQRPEIARLHQRKETLRKELLACHLPKKLKDELEAGDSPRTALLKGQKSIAKDAGILPEHFELQYQQLSAIAHSQPMVIQAMIKHDPNDRVVCSMLEWAVKWATAYLAFSIRDYANLVEPAKNALELKFLRLSHDWAELFSQSFPATEGNSDE